ncbi:hypothetical protein DRP07_02760 [Archaeoglobales archaeon]|nr:MAG: hypothetical protein DRP07_02760 [Archaeoglobales archaeon]
MRDLSQIEHKFKEYKKKIQRLKQCERELSSLDVKEFSSEVSSIKSKLKDPRKVDAVEIELSSLREKAKEEIDNITYETNSLIEKGRSKHASNEKNLKNFIQLQYDLNAVYVSWKSGAISYIDARAGILNLRKQAETLSASTPKKPKKGPIPKETHYDILGIDPKASQDEIKKAYRKKMLEYHPDRIGSWAKTDKVPSWVKKESDEMSKKINKAYEVLSDINKRKEYDKEIGVN